MVLVEEGDVSFYINKGLKAHWDKNSLAYLKKANLDRVYIVDGGEGSGKSVFTMQQMAYIEPSLLEDPEKFVDRIVFTPEDFMDKVRNVKNGVVIFDEAFRGLSSRAALSKTNKKLVQALMEMRQQNNVVFIVLPSIFMLDIYPAMLRSTGLFNIYAQKGSGKRVWQGYNKRDKNTLYQQGIKKGWTYFVRTKWRDYFFNRFPKDEFLNLYLKKKARALREMDKEEKKPEERNKYKLQRDLAIKKLKYVGLTLKEIEEIYSSPEVQLKKSMIRDIVVQTP